MEHLFDIGLVACAVSVFLSRRLLQYLRFMQQDDYALARFWHWFWVSRAFDRKGSLLLLAVAAVAYFVGGTFAVALSVCGFLALAYLEEDPRHHGKLRLHMTARARRIWNAAMVVLVVVVVGYVVVSAAYVPFWMSLLLAVVLVQSTPLYLAAAVLFLQRGERQRQQQYMREAKDILAKVNPFVIGITGSYGKTSTKQALGDILNITVGPTFWPVKGVNTPMGNTRAIREHLHEGHRYAIFEMGAYGKGSIERLCALTPPQAAIITAIGTAHLERFGSKEIILKTKSELAQAVPYEGILVCNGDDDGARSIAQRYPKKTTLLYGFDTAKGGLDCYISNCVIEGKGTAFVLHWRGKEYRGWTPSYGKLPLSNLMAAFTMACALGADPAFVLAAIRSQEPVENRLQPKKEGEVLYLHDAYNSNPRGFADALEVAQQLPGIRRILMTPGMIELGAIQYEENARAGAHAARVCDVVLVVGETNRAALVGGLKSAGFPDEKISIHNTRTSAFEKLAAIRADGDIILIENDLPDLYEATIRF